MDLELVRFCTQVDSTVGALYRLKPLGVPAPPGREFLCFTLEDERRTVKVPGETRIPAGRYRILLRRGGGMHINYAARFREMHKGMLHLQDVHNFEWVYLHTGNTTEHTRGCPLLGDIAAPRANEIQASEVAYRRVYPPIAAAILADEPVWLTVTDFA